MANLFVGCVRLMEQPQQDIPDEGDRDKNYTMLQEVCPETYSAFQLRYHSNLLTNIWVQKDA